MQKTKQCVKINKSGKLETTLLVFKTISGGHTTNKKGEWKAEMKHWKKFKLIDRQSILT